MSLCSDLVNEVFMVEDFLKMRFSMQTFIALPDAKYSKLCRWALLVRFAAPVNCTVWGEQI